MIGALLLAVLATIATFLVILAFSIRRDAFRSQRVSRATMDHLRVGLVEISGWVRVRDVPPLTAPLRGNECVQFTLQVDGRDPPAAAWEREAELSDSISFFVDDGTGAVFVKDRCWPWKPDRRAVAIVDDLPPSVVRRLTEEYGENPCSPHGEFKILETSLSPGDAVNVILRVISVSEPLTYDILRVSPESAVRADSSARFSFATLIAGGVVVMVVMLAIVMWR